MDENKSKIWDQCMSFLDTWLETNTSYSDGLFKGASAIAYYIFTKEEFEEFTRVVTERVDGVNK